MPACAFVSLHPISPTTPWPSPSWWSTSRVSARKKAFELLSLEAEPACWRRYGGNFGMVTLRPDLYVDHRARPSTSTAGSSRWTGGVSTCRRLLTKCRAYDDYYRTGIEQRAHKVFPRVCWIVPSSRPGRDLGREDRPRRSPERRHVRGHHPERAIAHPVRGGTMTPRNQIMVGDTSQVLATLAPSSVDCVVTSPPYFALRNYGVAGQMGLEDSVAGLGRRAPSRGPGPGPGTPSRWLAVAEPGRLLLPPCPLRSPSPRACCWGRSDWCWTWSPMAGSCATRSSGPRPILSLSSVGDRLSATWEVVYFLTRQQDYYFDLDAIRVPHRSRSHWPKPGSAGPSRPNHRRGRALGRRQSRTGRLKARGLPGHPLGKNPGDVWTLATAGYRGAHFAVFPERLAERPIRAACPERVCTRLRSALAEAGRSECR